jgi:hypothetical protein
VEAVVLKTHQAYLKAVAVAAQALNLRSSTH